MLLLKKYKEKELIKNEAKELIDLKKQIDLFSRIFSYYKYDDDFLDYLHSIEKPANNVCAKVFGPNEKAVRCEECAKYDISVICLDCYERTKNIHKFHTIFYETENIEGGCCDCGNLEVWAENSFCPLHKGAFSNLEEIDAFIKENFPEDIIEKLTNWFNNVVNILVPYFLEGEKKEKGEEIEKVLETFLNFLSKIFVANSALIHLMSKFLIRNYPYETDHICIVINDKNEMEINDYKGEMHMCECSFLKILLSVWTQKINNEELLFFFLQNYKIKIDIGLIYIGIYDKIIKNKCISLIYFTINQIYNSDLVLNFIKSPLVISNMFKYFYKYLETYIKEDITKVDEERINFIYSDIFRTIHSNHINLFSDNLELFDNFFNIIELCNNINSFEINNTINTFQREGFCNALIALETYLLNIFSYLMSKFDFNNKDLVKTIIQKFVDKFNNYKFLNSNTYSFHIILIRIFSLFLNWFCLFYSIKNNSNIYEAIVYIIKLIPNYESIIDILIREQMKFFGFILSVELNNFVYYGENMINYLSSYFIIDILYLLNFNLIKLLLTLQETIKYFSLAKIIELCSINDSLNLFNSIFLSNSDYNTIQKKQKNLVKKIIEFFTRLLKDNSSLYNKYQFIKF